MSNAIYTGSTYYKRIILSITLLFFFGFCSSVSAAVPQPLFLIQFEDNVRDQSGNNIVTTNASITTFNDGQRGKVGNFSGTNGTYVSMNVSLPTSFTKSAWVFTPTGTTLNQRHIISNGDFGFFPVSNFFRVNQGKLVTGGFPTEYAIDPNTFSTNTWTHVAMTYDQPTKVYKLYKDGVQIATGTGPVDPSPHTMTFIGSYNGNNNWLGYIDDAAMWNSVLSSTDINSVYNGTLTVSTSTVPQQIQSLTHTRGDGRITLVWAPPLLSGGPDITDYAVEYKQSSDVSWLTFNDGISTSTTSTVTGLTNGVSYDFRVSAVNSVGTGTSSDVISSIPNIVSYKYIFSSGQSLSIGSGALPPLSTTQPYYNLQLSGSNGGGINNGGRGLNLPLIPLTEMNVESPSSAMVNSLSMSSSSPIIVGSHGIGARPYNGLKKGTTQYADGMYQFTTARNKVLSEGNTIAPIGVTITHGENDEFQNLGVQYQGYLVEWQRDYQNDVNAIIGGSSTLPMFINQMNTGWKGFTAVSQYNAHKNNPNKIILVGPKYQYTYNSDKLHVNNTSSKLIGEMLAKVIKKVTVDNQVWNPLMPTSVLRDQNIITVSYNIPSGQLVLDTSLVAQRPNYGFEFVQTGGSASTTINSVELINNNTQVKVTLSGIPDGTDQKLRYAYTCYWNLSPVDNYGRCGDSSNGTYAGGNLRDTDTTISPASNGTDLPLYNWGVTFEESISPASVPSAPTALGATAGNAQVDLSWTAPASNGGASITDYAVEYKTSATSTWTTFSDGTSTSTVATVTGLTNATVYDFRVSATNSVGTGTSSASVSETPAVQLGPDISSLLASSISTSSATITFTTDVVGSTRIEYGPSQDYGNLTAETDTSPRVTSHTATLSGLSACTSYWYRVQSIANNGIGATSTASTFATRGCSAQAPILSTTAEAAPTATSTIVTLEKTPFSKARLSIPANYSTSTLTFQIKRLQQSTFASGISFPSGLIPATNHTYHLSALNASGTRVTAFDQSITITMEYEASEISGLDEATLEIRRWDGSTWNSLQNCSIDTTARTVSCATTGFSDFVLFGGAQVVTPIITQERGSSGGTGSRRNQTAVSPVVPVTNLPTPETADVGAKPFARNLELGVVGEDVNRLQSMLMTLGYLRIPSSTGYFGIQTQAALVEYQKAQGILPALGYFGPKTQAAMLDDTVSDPDTSSSQNASTTTSSSKDGFIRDLDLGYEGEDVKELQDFLISSGFVIPAGATGYFGPQTQSVLVQFQNKHEISPALGYFGPKTRTFMNGLLLR